MESYSDDNRTISTVATDTDTSSLLDLLHDDPEFDSLRLNSVVASRVPNEVITIDNLEEGEWTDEESIEDKAYKNVQELKISGVATGSTLTANRYEAHPEEGSQASTTNDKTVLWGFKWHTNKNPCRVRLICADRKSPVVPEGHGAVRIPADNAEGYVLIKCYHAPNIPNFILSPNSFKSLLGKHCNGYKLECNDDKKTWFSLNHKMRKSKSALLRGTTLGCVMHNQRCLQCR